MFNIFFLSTICAFVVLKMQNVELFLERQDVHKLMLFEEQCTESYLQQKDTLFHATPEERVRAIGSRCCDLPFLIQLTSLFTVPFKAIHSLTPLEWGIARNKHILSVFFSVLCNEARLPALFRHVVLALNSFLSRYFLTSITLLAIANAAASKERYLSYLVVHFSFLTCLHRGFLKV